MKALVQKEIRMLLPAFGGALMLAVLPILLLPSSGNSGDFGGWLFLFGVMMLGVSAFGREMGLKTFPFILAQPLERSRIWRTKISVLGICTALVLCAWWVTVTTSRHGFDSLENLAWMSLIVVVLITGGVWMTLLVRQMAAAFWLAYLVPAVAIRSDGTLWVSEKPGAPWLHDRHQLHDRHPLAELPAPLVQFGVETNWQSISGFPTLLLKRDGILWSWGTNDLNNPNYPGLAAFTPRRLDAGSNWVRMLRGVLFNYGWKRDGSAWAVNVEIWPTNRINIELTDLKNIHFRSIESCWSYQEIDVGVRDDGTLWYWRMPNFWQDPNSRASMPKKLNPLQIGKESDWAAISGESSQLVALKTDGSLWSWDFFQAWQHVPQLNALQEAPRRIGTHNDWVGLGDCCGQNVSLSADGTFWRLPGSRIEEGPGADESLYWLAPSRLMSKIENIFSAQE